jgi:aminocarboxymuconate-semialdehyde decarboxylase
MIVDVHAHFVPPSMLEGLEDRGREFGVSLIEKEPGCPCCSFETGLTVRPFFETILDVDKRLAEMDRQQVDREILTLWADVFCYDLPADKGDAWHRHMNEHLAQLAEATPERFSWMASGAMQDPAAAARELERCMKAGAVGAMTATEICGDNLGERDLDEFWAACVELKAPVFLHPAQPEAPARAGKYALNQVCAYTYDTTLSIGSLISAGVLDRFPGLELILSHGGGTLPWLIGRFDRMYRAAPQAVTKTVAAETPSAYLPRLWYDTILHDGDALRYLAAKVGHDRLLLGTDLPFPPGDPDPLASLRNAGFDDSQVRQIVETGPLKLFGIS